LTEVEAPAFEGAPPGTRALEGLVEGIVFRDPSPFAVMRVRVGNRLRTVVGEVDAPEVGKSYRFIGQMVEHPQYGEQFQAHWYEHLLPSDARAIEKYLSSGAVKGIGKGIARRIVKTFGDDTLRIIEESPERLGEVPRLKEDVRARLIAAMHEHRATRRVMLFLASHDITPALAGKIHRTFGSACIEILRRNPYRMAEDIWGVGFRIADSVAKRMGRPADDPFRLECGLTHALRDAQEEGHLFLPREVLIKRAAELLECAPETLEEPLMRASAASKVITEDDAVYLRPLYTVETRVAGRLRRLCERPGKSPPTDAQIESLSNLQLADKQKECLRGALSGGVFVMTGGPGTGKTTTVRGILQWCHKLELKAVLAAPTGRAARRMTEATGEDARTLHRLLEYAPMERAFKRDSSNPLKADVVIVDEASMIDIFLFDALLQALPDDAHLVLVGDVDQLPSVGPGSVLRDLIASERVTVVFLNEIFRQAEGSLIVQNAHRLNRGEMPLPGTANGDFFFIEEPDPRRAGETIVELCSKRLPDYYKFHPVEDVQVLSPMYRGDAGVTALNQRLQERLNPPVGNAPAAPVSNGQARVGDKLMQIRNNYERGVFNGDVGIVSAIDVEEEVLRVRFGGAPPTLDEDDVEYPFDEAGELALAYACSVHKSQGSEFPAVVIPLLTQHYVMLQRNLIYTAITRARKLVVLVGARRALQIAARNDRVEARHTRLAMRLCGEAPADDAELF